jgi:hypothetical protein
VQNVISLRLAASRFIIPLINGPTMQARGKPGALFKWKLLASDF